MLLMSILLNNISKQYASQTVLDDISLKIEQGELFVLLGASGSGKSTLLRIIAGLTPLDQGQIFFNDTDVTRLAPQKRDIGFVFQNYSLFRHMTAAQNIAFGLEIRGMSRPERQRRVEELLTLIELPAMGNRLPSQLSGGQQQRIALARALAPKPNVLLLDEPFGALDVKIRSQLRQNLREIQKRLGVTTILVTHDQDEAFELADRIGIIEKGALVETGEPHDLYRRPANRFTATFLGSANMLKGRRNGTGIYVGQHRLNAPHETAHLSGQEVEMLIRPESLDVAYSVDELQGEPLGTARVLSIAFAGAMERVILQIDGWDEETAVLMTQERARKLALRPGDRVCVGVHDFHLLPLN
jgi:sulfate transport system ATP-binding protein